MQALFAATLPAWVSVPAAAAIVLGAIVQEVRWHREFSRSARVRRRIQEWTR